MAGLDLARVVSTSQTYPWTQTEWTLGAGYGEQSQPRWHVVAYDFGIKSNILRMLSARGCKVTVVPAQTSAVDALALQPDGIFLSNGPGDPAATGQAPVRAEPGVGVDRAGPAVAEPDIGELREGDEEMRGDLAERLRAVLMAGVDAASPVIHRVVAAPQDPVVGRESVVVELVSAVADALA